jgi:hypothetical protein
MSESPNEAKWRAEFESLGEATTKARLENGDYTAEGKPAFGCRWLDDQAKARYSREIWSFRYTKWTLWVAVIAVIVGIIGIVVTISQK